MVLEPPIICGKGMSAFRFTQVGKLQLTTCDRYFPENSLDLHFMEFDEKCGTKWANTRDRNGRTPELTLHFGDQANILDLQVCHAVALGG